MRSGMLFVWLLTALPAPAALVRYDYTGTDLQWDDFSREAGPHLANVNSLAGYVVFDDSVWPDAEPWEHVTADISHYNPPNSFSFSDGLTTFSSELGDQIGYSYLSRRPNGEIYDWLIQIHRPTSSEMPLAYGDGIELRITRAGSSSDSVKYCAKPDEYLPEPGGWCSQHTSFASHADGSWTATVVPIPAAAWLFGSALLGLGWFRKVPA